MNRICPRRGSPLPFKRSPWRWCYVYRAIDTSGALVDVLFREHRDMKAAKAFFRSAQAVTGITPDRVTTDGHDSYPRAIRTELGQQVRHRTSRYRNNELEQDHRGLKGRYRPMRGFKCPRSAARFCRGYDELRNHLRSRSRHNQHVPANRRRLQFLRRTVTVLVILEAARPNDSCTSAQAILAGTSADKTLPSAPRVPATAPRQSSSRSDDRQPACESGPRMFSGSSYRLSGQTRAACPAGSIRCRPTCLAAVCARLAANGSCAGKDLQCTGRNHPSRIN
jgi:hypothetical protein